jgi:hypothetical protein
LETMRGRWSMSAAGQIETTPAHPAQLPAHLEKCPYRRTTMFVNLMLFSVPYLDVLYF